jgi:glycosyltransferase involved in cell wall biosynthesis
LRVAIANFSHRLVAGVETYLQQLAPELLRRDCEIGFFSEINSADTTPAIIDSPMLRDVPIWCIADLGASCAFATLRDWRPDLIYVHGILDIDVEAQLLAIAPAVFFAHAYTGTCISARKSFRIPTIEPCDRRFGAACLAYYYPRRCGGLNPATMWRDYRRQAAKLLILRRYRAIIASSEHMRREYLKHGFAADTVHVVRLPITRLALTAHKAPILTRRTAIDRSSQLRLLFAGRMVFEKGGDILIHALPRVAALARRPVRLDLAGDGNARTVWDKSAHKIMQYSSLQNYNVETIFHRWLESADLAAAFDSTDLLVVPSVWPEPFGLIGPEAGLHSIPAAAFAVGGISEWLHDGVNGHLADAHPCCPDRLADAIAECVRDEAHYTSLREGAFRVASKFGLSDHVSHLLGIFLGALHDPSATE